MAKQNKKDIEVKDAEVVKPTAKKLPKETYTVKVKVKVGDKDYKKGDKISLTKEGYRYLRSLKKV